MWVNVGGNGRKRGSVANIFFLVPFHITDCLFIFTNSNPTLIVMNNIRKKLVMITTHYRNQIIANQSTILIKIGNIDSNH